MNENEIGKLVIDASMNGERTLMILLCVLGVLGGEALKP